MKIELTDGEWMEIIDGDRDGLPRCCANVSTLRDEMISAARNGGTPVFGAERLGMYLGWVYPEHDLSPVMQKVCDQVGWTVSATDDHERDAAEL